MKKICIIDYGSGNLHSVAKAIAASEVQVEVNVSSQAADLKHATHIILPGVGAFNDCISGLLVIPGLIDQLKELVLEQKRPFLGICVGMQMLASKGYEHGVHAGLNWIKGEVVPIIPEDKTLKIPHMGWNTLQVTQSHPVLAGLESSKDVYFVHSYHFKCEEPHTVIAEVVYGQKMSAILAKENLIATQFHPEKSQKVGLTFLENFLRWMP